MSPEYPERLEPPAMSGSDRPVAAAAIAARAGVVCPVAAFSTFSSRRSPSNRSNAIRFGFDGFATGLNTRPACWAMAIGLTDNTHSNAPTVLTGTFTFFTMSERGRGRRTGKREGRTATRRSGARDGGAFLLRLLI